MGLNAPQAKVVSAARQGDSETFSAAVEPHWSELHAHCYRLLGSTYDADDALQDSLLRAWRGLARLDPQRPVRPWLFKIATNVCLDMLRGRSRRFLPFDTGSLESDADARPLSVSSWITPYPDRHLDASSRYAVPDARYEEREAIELAFVTALLHLPARQRAVLVLHDVLGFSIAEIAENLDATKAAVNSALQRGRKTLGGLLPERSQLCTQQSLGDERVRAVARRFVDAYEGGDVKGMIDLLDGDSSFAMPPYAQWCRGRDAVSRSWLIPPPRPGLFRVIPVRANGQLAFAVYVLREAKYVPIALDVVSLTESRIGSVVAFRNTEVFDLFNLPAALPLES